MGTTTLTTNYSVLPEPVTVATPTAVDLRDVPMPSLGPYVVMGILIFVVLSSVMSPTGWFLYTSLAIAAPLVVREVNHRQLLAAERRRAVQASIEAWKREKVEAPKRALRDAEQATAAVRAVLDASTASAGDLETWLADAARALDRSELEHTDRAFSPFWDAVEASAQSMSRFRSGVASLARSATSYYAILNGKRHTFPSFPYVPAALPDPGPILTRFKQVVRMGQTDFEFANIWEHRKTREAIQTGFGSLEAAVRDVGSILADELQGLANVMRTGVASVVDAQIISRDGIVGEIDSHRRETVRLLKSQHAVVKNIDRRLSH